MNARDLDRRSEWPRRILIGLTVGYLGILLLAPLAALVKTAFSKGFWGLAWALADPDVWRALRFSLALALGATAVNTVFGVAVAWVLVRHRFPGRKVLNALVDLPFAVSPVVAGYMLILLFGRQGYLRALVKALDLHIVFNWPGMLLATAFVTMPFVVREAIPVLQEFGRDQEEAAATLGAGAWITFRRVTLPAIRWGVLYGMALTLARALGEFGAVYVVSGALRGSTETSTLFIFRAMDERMAVAVGGVSLFLAGISFAFLTGVEACQRRLEGRARPVSPFGMNPDVLEAAPEDVTEGDDDEH